MMKFEEVNISLKEHLEKLQQKLLKEFPKKILKKFLKKRLEKFLKKRIEEILRYFLQGTTELSKGTFFKEIIAKTPEEIAEETLRGSPK